MFAKTSSVTQALVYFIKAIPIFQLDVKTTSKGGITITTKTNGSLQLTTKKKIAAKKPVPPPKQNTQGKINIDYYKVVQQARI
jgi:hypothetical protein